MLTLADHLLRFDARHLLRRPVPGDYAPCLVNHKGGIRQEFDDLRQTALRFPKRLFG
jgi:hypothetical protein